MQAEGYDDDDEEEEEEEGNLTRGASPRSQRCGRSSPVLVDSFSAKNLSRIRNSINLVLVGVGARIGVFDNDEAVDARWNIIGTLAEYRSRIGNRINRILVGVGPPVVVFDNGYQAVDARWNTIGTLAEYRSRIGNRINRILVGVGPPVVVSEKILYLAVNALWAIGTLVVGPHYIACTLE